MIKSTTGSPLAILVGRNIFSSAVLLLYLRRFPDPLDSLEDPGGRQPHSDGVPFHLVHQADDGGQCHLPAVHRAALYHPARLLVPA